MKKDTPMYLAAKEWGDFWEWESISFIQDNFNKVLNPIGKKIMFLGVNDATNVKELKGWDVKYGLYALDNKLIKYITFEIKSDKFPSTNVFFERTCSKKKSGVYVSTADYFVYIMPRHQKDNFFICKPEQLINTLENNQYHLTYGGEGNRVSGWCVDKTQFSEDYLKNGGKLWSWNVTIPEKFNVGKFNDTTKKSNTSYSGDVMKKYEDPFNW